MVEVGIVVGSKADLPVIRRCADILMEMGIESETTVLSAHRTPELTVEWAKWLRQRRVKVVVTAAGMAAARPGTIAAHTTLAVMAIGDAGAKNAAYLAAEITGLSRPEVAEKDQQLRDGFVAAAREQS